MRLGCLVIARSGRCFIVAACLLAAAVPVPTAYVLVLPVPDRVQKARTDGVAVVTLSRGISIDLAQAAPWQLLGAKTLSYASNMAALRFASRMGADDVIFTSTENRVLEGPRSSVVIARDKQLITPPAKNGVLPGVTQRALFFQPESCGPVPGEHVELVQRAFVEQDG